LIKKPGVIEIYRIKTDNLVPRLREREGLLMNHQDELKKSKPDL